MGRQFPALAGLAIVVVALHHAITFGLESSGRLGAPAPAGVAGLVVRCLFNIGAFAVPTFLFISGAFVAYAARGEPPRLSRSFVLASLARLGWPYVFWSLVSYGTVFLWSGERYTVLGYLKNLVVGYPFHFVPLLAFYYLVSPVLVHLSRRHGGALIAGAGLYQLALIALAYPELLDVELPQAVRVLAPPVLGQTLATWAICFPLGLTYGLSASALLPRLQRLRWPVIGVTAALFAVDLFSPAGLRYLIVVRVVYSVTFLMLVPLIRRDAIPFVTLLERVGKRSYGVYLVHLSVLMLTLSLVERVAPHAFDAFLLLVLFLFVPAVGVPLLLMTAVSRARTRLVYRYVFG